MSDFIISVNRDTQNIAVFNDFECIHEFEPYTNESEAVEKMKGWLRCRTSEEPRIIYPRITRAIFKYSSGRRRK